VAGLIPDGQDDHIRARQRSRATVMAIALAAFAILLFAITIAKMTVNQ
jgi:hypothetical protein